jgi:hypothetical protein
MAVRSLLVVSIIVIGFGAFQLTPAAAVGAARPIVSTALSSQAHSATNETKLTASVPLANTIQRNYNWVGYNGNSTIYPTNDTYVIDLPIEHDYTYQTACNSTMSTGSCAGVANTNLLNVSWLESEPPAYATTNLNHEFEIQMFVDEMGGATTIASYPQGCNNAANELLGGAIVVTVSPSGLPADNTNSFVIGPDTGFNTTNGTGGGNPSDKLLTLVSLALDIAAVVFPEVLPLDIIASSIDLSELVNSVGPDSSFWGTNSNTNVAGDGEAVQLEQVDGGVPPISCQTPSSLDRYGQNTYSQADMIQEEMPAVGSQPGTTVSPGSLTVGGYNDLLFEDAYAPSSSYTSQGATASVSYAIDPAASLGGWAYLYKGGPLLPGASITVQQQQVNQTYFQNIEETTNGTGYWHTFIKPNTYQQYSQYWSDFTNPLGTSTAAANPLPAADLLQGANKTLDFYFDGGQVYGTVQGLVGSTYEDLSGATVKMCNTQGCISNTTNSAGQYSLDFPVNGTSSDPFSFTVSHSEYNTTTYSSYTLRTGGRTQENFALTPIGGGCVASGTPILTPSGYVPIQDLSRGSTVEEYDLSSLTIGQGILQYANTTEVNQIVEVNDGLLYLTPTDQPIYIENNSYLGWLPDPQNLTIGDNLFEPMTNSWLHVNSVQLVNRHVLVYDVVTSGQNDFIANGALLDKKG